MKFPTLAVAYTVALTLTLTLSLLYGGAIAAPGSNSTVLDGTPLNVTGRPSLPIYYGKADRALLLAFARALPRDSLAMIDIEPLPANATDLAEWLAAVRPDVRWSWYGVVNIDPYAESYVAAGSKLLGIRPDSEKIDAFVARAQRTHGMVEGLLRVNDFRARNDLARPLLKLTSYTEIHCYPTAEDTPASIGLMIDAYAAEAYRVGNGKPIVMLVSAVIDQDGKRLPWTPAKYAAVTAGADRNGIELKVVWDGPAATFEATEAACKVFAAPAKALATTQGASNQ
jgi:hypothetical protein